MRVLLSGLIVAASALLAQAESLKVAYNEWAGFTPVFVAAEKGFFKQAGADVELVAFPGPGDSLPPLVAGHIDVSLTTPDNAILLAATADAKVRAIYMIDASLGADALVARGGIKKPADLKGKTVAVTEGEVNHLLLLKALESAGMSESDIRIVNMNPDDAGAALVAGSVDAAVTWEPWVSKAVSAGGTKVFTSADAPNLLLDVVATTEAVIEAKPEQLMGLIKGLEKAVQYMKTNPDDAYALAGKWLNIEGSEVEAMLGGVKIYTWEENMPLMGVGVETAGLIGPLESIAEFLKSRGKIRDTPDVAAMVVSSFLEE